MKTFLFVIATFFVGLGNLHAGIIEIPPSVLKTVPGGTPLAINTTSAAVSVSGPSLTESDLSQQGVVTVGIDHHYPVSTPAYQLKIGIEVSSYDALGASIGSPIIHYFNIAYAPNDSTSFRDRMSIIVNTSAYSYTSKIVSIEKNGVSVTIVPANVYVNSNLFIDRIINYTSASASAPTVNDYILYDTDSDSIKDEIEISWATQIGAEEYQLEWAFVNDYKDASTFLSGAELENLKVNFKLNSTRITTTSTSYRISLAFDHGYLVFRVRGSGRKLTELNRIIFSPWSQPDQITIGGVGGILGTGQNKRCYVITQSFEVNKNWQYSTTYAEEGKKKEVVSFFDGSLRNRQMVTKINSDNNTIVGETVYDHQGRPVIQVLPTPVEDNSLPYITGNIQETSLKYYPNFTKDSLGNEFERTDFDTSTASGICTVLPEPMSTASGASRYYSSLNPDNTGVQGYLPDAERFPYSQVEYTPDNTGRIRRQGGVGDEFQLGTGHESKYFYAHPFQENLNNLFGSEVGNAAHYQKNMVVDPNGQVSVSYLDQEGRVIATSLAGEAPLTLKDINLPVTYDNVTVDLFAKNAAGVSVANELNEVEASKEFNQVVALSAPSSLTLSYSMSVDPFTTSCLTNVCFSCIYDLEIEIRNDCGELIPNTVTNLNNLTKMVGRFTVNPTTNKLEFYLDNTNCTYNNAYSGTFTTAVLPIGTYQITKRLSVNQEALDSYIDQYLTSNSNTCKETFESFQTELEGTTPLEDCNVIINCDSCVTALGSLEDFIANGEGTQEDYELAVELCKEPCKADSYYETMYEQLRMDFVPGNQYAQYILPSGVVAPSNFPLSIFNTSNKLPVTNNYIVNSVGVSPATWKFPRFTRNGTTQFEYFEEDLVTPSRVQVTVTLNATGAIASTNPPVSNFTSVIVDPLTLTGITPPQNLANVTDFIAEMNANPSWTHSLVEYHPEYGILKTFGEFYTKFQPTDPRTSEEFDALMSETDTWEKAVTNGFIKTNWQSYPVLQRLNNFTVNTFPNYDPFTINANATNYGSSNSAIYAKIFQNYQIVNLDTLSMFEVAALTVRCGSSTISSSAPSTACIAWGGNMPGFTNINDPINIETRNKEWQAFRNLYYAYKQQLQLKAAFERSLTQNGYEAYNKCIGNEDFDPFDNNFLTVTFPNLGGEFLDELQPCSELTAQLYAGKQKRFLNPLDQANMSANAVAYQQYLLTGQCPTAASFEAVLSELAGTNNLLNANYQLTNLDAYTGMILAENDYQLSASLPSRQWALQAQNSTDLSAQIKDGATVKYTLALHSTSSIVWSNIIGFQNLRVDNSLNPTYNFTVTAIVSTGGVNSQVQLKGLTNLPIGACRFDEVCEANAVGNSIEKVIKTLALSNQLFTTFANLPINVKTTSPYSTFVNTQLQIAAGVIPTSTLKYSYNTSNKTFSFYKSDTLERLKLTVNSTINFTNYTSIVSLSNLVVKQDNTFDLVFINNLGNTVTFKCDAIYENLATTTKKAIPLGDCALPTPALCDNAEVSSTSNLFAVLKDVIITQDQPFNLLNSIYVDAPLLGALPSTTLPTAISSSVVSTTPPTIKFEYSVTSGTYNVLELKIIQTTNSGVGFDQITSMTTPVLSGIPDNNGNYHSFTFTAQAGSNVTMTIEGTTNLNLQECGGCLESVDFTDSTYVQQTYSATNSQANASTKMPMASCQGKHSEYAAIMSIYNTWATNNGKPTDTIYPYQHFREFDLCNCVDAYNSYLNSIMDELTTINNNTLLSINEICYATTTPPCTPNVNLNNNLEAIELPYLDPCAEFNQANLDANATTSYEQWVQQTTTDLATAYTKHCLGALENFTMSYVDREQHFTLYYYDQAGDLIKTIPPEGVQKLGVYADPSKNTAINNDRANGTHFVPTNHRMATTYLYNSLNQLVAQSMPDQDAADVFELTQANGLAIGLNTTAIQMLNENTGYLTGFVTVGGAALTAVSSSTVPFVSRSYVYITENGGKNWTRLPNTMGANLKKIAWSTATPTTGYAIGEQGTLLYTNNGGQTWDLYNSFANSIVGEYVAVEVLNQTTPSAANRVYATLKNGNIYYWNLDLTGFATASTVNTVTDPVTLVNASALISIQDVELNQTSTSFTNIAPYALATLNFDGKITFDAIVRKNTITDPWQIVNITNPQLNTMTAFGLNHALSFGTNGSIVEFMSSSAVTSPSPVNPLGALMRESGTTNSITQAFFVNGEYGIAKIQGLTQSEIMYTKDGGKNWIHLNDALFDYTLCLIEQTTSYVEVLAYSTTRRIRLRLMTNGDMIFIDQSPDTPETTALNFVSISAVKESGLVTYFGVLSTGQVHRSLPLATSSSEIKFSITPLLTTPGGAAKEILVKRTSSQTSLTVLSPIATGKVYTSSSTTTSGSFTSLTAATPTTAIFSDIECIDIGGTLTFVAMNTFDNKLYSMPANSLASGFSTNGTNAALTSTARIITGFGNKIYVSGTGSNSFVASFSATNTYTRIVRSTIGTLPKLNDINKSITNEFQVAGNNGRYISVASIAGTLIPTSSTKNLRAVTRFGSSTTTRTLLVGQSGTLLAFNSTNALISTATTSGNPIDVTVNYNDLNSIDFRSPSANVFSIYVVGENGSILYTPDFTTTPFSGISNAANANLNGVKWIPGLASAHVVADDGKLFRLTNMSLSQNHNVFVQRLTDIHFADAATGTIVGINYTIRTTIDGGKTWRVVLPDVYPTLPSLNKVWTFKTSTSDPHFAIVGGTTYLRSVYQNTLAAIPAANATGTLTDIQFSKNSPLNGYYLMNATNALRRFILTPSTTAGFTIASPTLTPTGSITGTAKAMHVFENQYVAILSTNGAITYFNNATPAYSSLLVAPSPAVLMNDIYFHDDVYGYMVGKDVANNNASIFRLKSNSLATNNVITSFSGTVIPTTTITNAGGNVADNINAIAFGSRYDGVYGGSYNSTTTTNVNFGMVRTIHDENQLFTARFFYDRLGRIVLSQNSRQYGELPQKKYSYTLYDALGRVTEAGEKTENTTGQKFSSIFGTYVGGTSNPNVINDANLALWLIGDGSRREVTRSYYDASVPTIVAMIPVSSGFTSDPLTQRKRIVHVTYEELRDNDDATYDHATHYDYDIHGNVESMLQDNFKLAKEATDIANQRFKKLDYKYDLISGNVHRVSYQAGQKDQWHHSYSYDADNRITNAYTTTATPISGSLSTVSDFQVEPEKSPYWDLEASYEYYDHGPLARTELAAEKVQGVDYVYTLQGWMKGVNSNNLTTANDPGKDGTTSASNHQNVAVDVMGYSLQYYNGDFVAATAANGSFVAAQTGSDLDGNSNELYNGNIGTMVTTITDPNSRAILPLGNAYKYDQLNRLADAKSFTNLVGNSWGSAGTVKYENNFAYDANGNITKQLRKNELGNVIDSLTYRYDDGANGRKRNRLYHVRDQVLSGTFSDDIDNMGTFTSGININSANNYKYDEEGRLKSDAQEGITNIVWRVDGKIKEIIRLDNTKKRIRFDYDAMGHRIAKHVGTTDTLNNNPATNFILEASTYYVLDAQGNTMSVYERTVNGIAATIKYEQAEKHIYGSSRLGVMNVAVNLLGTAGTTPYSQINWTHKIGQRTYELVNHLNNVLSVISDKVIPHASGGSVAYYKADILQAQDYSPFGVTLKGRNLKKTGLADEFRFGFNGMETDDEMKGDGNSYDFGARMLDTRLGRWLSIDNFSSKYPYFSSYSSFGNNPLIFNDVNGDYLDPVNSAAQSFIDKTADKFAKAYTFVDRGSGLLGIEENFESFKQFQKHIKKQGLNYTDEEQLNAYNFYKIIKEPKRIEVQIIYSEQPGVQTTRTVQEGTKGSKPFSAEIETGNDGFDYFMSLVRNEGKITDGLGKYLFGGASFDYKYPDKETGEEKTFTADALPNIQRGENFAFFPEENINTANTNSGMLLIDGNNSKDFLKTLIESVSTSQQIELSDE